MSAFGRIVALIGLILIGFGLFTPVVCPNTGCIIPDHSFIDTHQFENEFTIGLTQSQPAIYLVIVSVVIILAIIGGYRFATFTAALMLLTIISMYLAQSVLNVTRDGATEHLGWGWSLLMVGGVLLLIATLPKSDQLLEDEGYDDYYEDQSPTYDPRQVPQWQPSYQQQTMAGGWQQQMPLPPPQPPQQQQPLLASGMVSGMYGTNPQPIQSRAMPVPQVPQRPLLPAQPPPDPLRQTEPDLLNQDRMSAAADSRQLSRSNIAQPSRPAVPSPRSSQRPAASPPTDDKEATNEFATPQPLNQTPNMIQPQSSSSMTGVINRPSPSSKPRAVDQSSQAMIRTLISEDSKTIVPADLQKPPSATADATEPDRLPERAMPRADLPPIPATPSKSTGPVPAPRSMASDLDDKDEVDLMRVTGMIRSPKPKGEPDVDLMRASGSIRPPKPTSLSTEESQGLEKGKTTRAFGKGPPLPISDDRAAFLLNPMADEDQEPEAEPIADASPPILAAEPKDEQPTQSFGKPPSPPSTDRADFMLTAASELDELEDHDTNYPILDDAAFDDDDDIRTFAPVEEDDSLPFGVPVLEDEDDDDPEEDNETDPELRDKFDDYAAKLIADKEDTGPYDVPILEDDDDDDDENFQTIISPD